MYYKLIIKLNTRHFLLKFKKNHDQIECNFLCKNLCVMMSTFAFPCVHTFIYKLKTIINIQVNPLENLESNRYFRKKAKPCISPKF